MVCNFSAIQSPSALNKAPASVRKLNFSDWTLVQGLVLYDSKRGNSCFFFCLLAVLYIADLLTIGVGSARPIFVPLPLEFQE